MKYLIGLLVAVLMISCVSGLSVSLGESYKAKETMIFEIQGNLLEPVKVDNVEWKRGNVRVPVEFDVKRLGGKTYIWAIAPSEGDYTFYINNVATTVEGVNKEIDFEQDFSVVNGSIGYNVKPGFVIAQDDFELNVFLYGDVEQDIEMNGGSFKLGLGDNKIKIDVDLLEEGLQNLKVGDYSIPLYIVKDNIGKRVWRGNVIIDVVPIEIQRIVMVGSGGLFYPILLKNSGEESIDYIEIWSDHPRLRVKPIEIKNISIGDEVEINLSVLGSLDEKIESVVYIQAGSEVTILPVSLDVSSDNATVDVGGGGQRGFYCVELGGRLCVVGEVCNGETKSALDGGCCLGVCSDAESSSGGDEEGGWGWIGWLLMGIVVLVVIIVFVKFKKAKPSASAIDKAKTGKK